MLAALMRKGRQVATDAVLRRFLIARAFGRMRPVAPFTPHKPPYLAMTDCAFTATPDLPAAQQGRGQAIHFSIHGQHFAVNPDDPARLFDSAPPDIETLLALHRFAWLDLADDADPVTVGAVWRAWFLRFGEAPDGWAWHPYTATERVIALLDHTERHGWPGGDAQFIFARHGDAILRRLEYFGDHHTSNHLANNGRGLAHLGLRLGDAAIAEIGLRIMLQEAERIFLPSGVLREGSSHYHLLYAVRFAEMADLARCHGRPEADALATIAQRAAAVLPHFHLPGGMPLMGDISPDVRPAALLEPATSTKVDVETLRGDGWLRFDRGEWAGLWHAAPEGWSHMPGHGHQDCGSFELHWRGQPVFVDLGRGAYGEDGEAELYRSAKVHNGVVIDGADPYPANRPYFDTAFRRSIGGAPPRLEAANDSVTLAFAGYGRLGIPQARRRWTLGENLVIEDWFDGYGSHRIERRLHTTFPVTSAGMGRVVVETPAGRLQITADGPITLEHRIRWLAYGEGIPATAIVIAGRSSLPWHGSISVEVL